MMKLKSRILFLVVVVAFLGHSFFAAGMKFMMERLKIPDRLVIATPIIGGKRLRTGLPVLMK